MVFYTPCTYFEDTINNLLSVSLEYLLHKKICLYHVYEEFYTGLKQPKTHLPLQMSVGMKFGDSKIFANKTDFFGGEGKETPKSHEGSG